MQKIKMSLEVVYYLIRYFFKEAVKWLKNKQEEIKMLFSKKSNEYYKNISNLAFYWREFAQKNTLSNRQLKFIADEGAMFACFMVNKISLKNFITTVAKSEYKDCIVGRWQKRSRNRRCDWRLRYGASTCLELMERIAN